MAARADPAHEALGVLEVGAVAGVGKQHQLVRRTTPGR
jgi:hypothetical protein